MGCGSGVTCCWRRLKEWQEAGVWERLLQALCSTVSEKPTRDRLGARLFGLGERPGQKRGRKTGPNPTDKGKPGTKRHLLVLDRGGIPLSVMTTAANVNDSMVFEELLDSIEPIKRPRGRPRKRPEKLHADKASYDDKKCARARSEKVASRGA